MTSRVSQSGVLYAWWPVQVVWIRLAFTNEVNQSEREDDSVRTVENKSEGYSPLYDINVS